MSSAVAPDLESLPRTAYGAGKYPYGPCDKCDAAACHRVANDNGTGGFVCRTHLPDNILFAPFLGQQEKLIGSTCRYVLGGGGAGPGKTYLGARLWLKQWQVEEARFRSGEIKKSKAMCLFLRRTMPEIMQVIDDFLGYYKQIDPGAKWDSAAKICRFTCGLLIRFGGMEDENDWQKYWGDYWTLVVMDEAVQFTVKQIEKIDQRIRCSDPVLSSMLQLYLLTNPIGGATKQYLKRRFVKAASPEQEVRLRTKLNDGRIVDDWQVYIPSNLFDNPALMEDGRYEANLLRSGTITLRALLFNDWDVDEGAWVGDDWDPSVHVCEPFTIPAGWTRIKGMDYGHDARSAVHWYAVDPENNLVCYRSFSCRRKTAEELGLLIREIEIEAGEWDINNDMSTIFGPGDASLWSRVGESSLTRGEKLDNLGCAFFRGPNTYAGYREDAADEFRRRLRRRSPNAAGEMLIPGIRFFRTCKSRLPTKDGGWDETGPIATIPSVGVDDTNPDRWDTAGDDHDLDTTGMVCMARPLSGEIDSVDSPAQAVVYELLKFRKQQNKGGDFPNWNAK